MNQWLILAVTLMIPSLGMMEQRWAILSAFPKPMPIQHDAKVFPRILTTSKQVNLPSTILDSQVSPLGENHSFQEAGSLCFQIVQPGECITLNFTKLGWFYAPKKFNPKQGHQSLVNYTLIRATRTSQNYTTEVTWFNGTTPVLTDNSPFDTPPRQYKWAPSCPGTYEGVAWPWTDCQSPAVRWAAHQYFTLSPSMCDPGEKNKCMKSGIFQQDRRQNPFHKWMLCGINGGCSDISTFIWLLGGTYGRSLENYQLTVDANLTSGVLNILNTSETCLNTIRALGNVTQIPPSPVCVRPPFLFILSNKPFANCTNETCWLSQCWNGLK